MGTEDRFKAVEARCSGLAAEMLRNLKGHPRLEELLTELERIDGMIFSIDVERVLLRLAKQGY